MKKEEIRKVNHPLEDVFDIEPGTTTEIVEYNDGVGEIVAHVEYDPKDTEIEVKLQQIADAAMDGFDAQVEVAQDGEIRHAARNMEVANALLGTALGAVKELADIKKHKDKIVAATKKAPTTVNQNLIVATRNEILRKLLDGGKTEE